MVHDGEGYRAIAANEYVLAGAEITSTRSVFKLFDEEGNAHFLPGKDSTLSFTGDILECSPRSIKPGMGAEVKGV